MSLQLPSTTPINDLVKIIDNLPATTPKTNIKSISPILTQALQNSQTYSFSPLLTHPNVVAAKAAATTSSSSSESQSLLSALALVEIFESQSTVQFTSSTQSLPQLNTIMQRKLEILSLIRLAASSSREVPYQTIASACLFEQQTPDSHVSSVESLVLDALSLTILTGKLNQKAQIFKSDLHKTLSAEGVGSFGNENEVGTMLEKLRNVKARGENCLKELDKLAASNPGEGGGGWGAEVDKFRESCLRSGEEGGQRGVKRKGE